LKKKDYQRALADYGKGIELDPKDSAAYIGRGDVYAALNDFEQAAADLTTAIRLDDKNPEAYLARGWIRENQHDYQRAIDDYTAAIGLKDKELQAYNNLAWIWATCPKMQFRNAATALEYGLHICKASEWKKTAFFDTLAAAYAANGNFAQAVLWQKKAVAAPDAYDSEEERQKGQRRLKLYEQGKSYTDD
jgi:serine/threonine-protein kinase